MPHLLIHGEQQRGLAAQGHVSLRHLPRQGQQHRGGSLVVQVAALHIAAFGHHRAGVEGHKVPCRNAQSLGFRLGMHVLIHHDFEGFVAPGRGGLVAPHMAAGMGGLHRA